MVILRLVLWLCVAGFSGHYINGKTIHIRKTEVIPSSSCNPILLLATKMSLLTAQILLW